MSIPILDASALASELPAARAQLVADFGAAYRTVGFSYLINHGIEKDLIADLFAASHVFHALPQEEKMQLELSAANRGFLPINASTDTNTTLAEVTAPNQSESFIAMCEHAPDSVEIQRGDYLAGANQWPDLPGFAETVMRYHSAMCRLGRQMMAVAAEALSSDPEPVVAAFDSPLATVRMLRYPPHPVEAPPGMFGSAPHRDYGCLTFLAQDDTGGLSVATPDGDWIDVAPIEGAFVVNVGDLLHQWSNGEFISTPHRVINTSGSERYSVPFFFDPNDAAVVAPLASCVSDDRPAEYEPVRVGTFLRNEYEAGFDHHRRGGTGDDHA